MCRNIGKVGDGMNPAESERLTSLLLDGEKELAIEEERDTPEPKPDELDEEVRGIRQSDCVFDGKFEWWPMKKRPDVNIGDHVRIYFVKVSHD